MQVTDPVCHMTIDSVTAEAREIWKGQTYYFCSKSCHDKFRSAPEQYAGKPDEHGAHGSPSR
jgi:YHS domain-containing protein